MGANRQTLRFRFVIKTMSAAVTHLPDNLLGLPAFFDRDHLNAHRHCLLAFKAKDNLSEIDHFGDIGVSGRYFSNQFAHGSLLVGPTPSPLGAKGNGSLKRTAARSAFPAVTHVARVGVFGRLRYEQPLATSGAADKRGVGRSSQRAQHVPTLGLRDLKGACLD